LVITYVITVFSPPGEARLFKSLARRVPEELLFAGLLGLTPPTAVDIDRLALEFLALEQKTDQA
jgi:hypothetical protein